MADDFETADTFAQNRMRMAPFLGLLILLVQQGTLYAWDWGSDSLVQILLNVGFTLVMLALLLTGGGWFLSRRARALANDEVTQAHRNRGIRIGFATAIVTACLVFSVSPFDPLHAQRAANIIVSMGLGMAFLTYGLAERMTDASDA
ncbi:MAG: hypothetical protein DI637_03235 [Citromicrobium sp.]|nr:MAG: hypothetical protein DI637_03235 [Citromicrobium sp.]